MPSETTISITALSGSLRPGSFTNMALRIALQAAAASSPVVTSLLDLRELQLPWANGRRDYEVDFPDVVRLREHLRQSDGIILGTPDYHGSFSGVLKNALDLTGFEEWEGKMVALVGVGGGRLGAHEALNSLRHIGRALHAWVIPDQVSIPEAHRMFDAGGQIRDRDLEARLTEVGKRIARFAYLHKCGTASDFLANWEKAHPNPGAGE